MNASTTTTAQPKDASSSTKKNTPSHETFTVEGEGQDTRWTKVGIAFPTKSGRSHRVFIGKKGDPKQKVYLVCPTSQFDGKDNSRPGDEPRRKIYANVFDATNHDVDVSKRDGVAFLNRDDSLSLLIGDRGDAQQLKYQMREVRRYTKKQAKA